MARIRQIKPDFFRSEDVANLEPIGRLLFIGLWTLADREGRLLDRPRRIAIELFPYDRMDEKIDLLLGSLAARGLIVRYVRDGVGCIQITGFGKHQKPHPKEPATELPPPPPERDGTYTDTPNRGETRQATDEVAAENVLQPSSSVVLDPSSGSMGSGVSGEISASLRSESPPKLSRPSGSPIPELEFECDGAIRIWHVTREQIAEWGDSFPSLDVLGECRKALAWTRANPSKRKTARGMPAFLVNWLGRCQDRGRAGSVNGVHIPASSSYRPIPTLPAGVPRPR